MSDGVPTFVLVHGGMHGGWCWRRVARRLRDAGAEVFTPTLTGLGERAHLNNPNIDLECHIEDVVRCIESEELLDFVLVGHSYGGMVITGVADRMFERVRQLVYLDALVPGANQSAIDVMGGSRAPDSVEMLDVIPGYDFGVSDPSDIDWVRRRVTPQSAKTIRQKLPIRRDLSRLDRHFFACTSRREDSPVAPIARLADKIRADPTWRYREFATGHDAMISAPADIADALLDISRATKDSGAIA